jgi:hypothetical protein
MISHKVADNTNQPYALGDTRRFRMMFVQTKLRFVEDEDFADKGGYL